MGGAPAAAAVALLAATRRRPAAGPLAFLLPRAARAGLHEAAAPAAEEKGRTRRRRRRRSSSSRLLGPDIPDTWDSPPRAAARPPPPSGAGVDYDSTATIIDGKSVAEDIRFQIAEEVRQMKNAVGHVPGLAVVLVGDRRDSESYVRYKIKGCEEVGIKSLLAELPGNCTEDVVVDSVSRFNEDPSVHGILVQLPLPQHMDEERILSAISLEKDVDGFHPLNVGNLALRSRKPLFVPCAAKACLELLLQSGIELMGKHVTVIGRSKVVGLPTSLLLQRHHATVSIIHAFTTNPEEITRQSDIVISAAGVANLVRGSWLKKGAVVIDVGTNPIEDPTSDYGYRLTGDVCFEEAVKLASAITPVPGGVGPVTIAMLLANTLDSAKLAYGLATESPEL
ncbi:bifunctional protein FolD 1, mitochondrial-like isoform X1 [Oryza glaberrima]|uniref:Methenyltetrahydrofolate cyclohydrolase n=2 Tax=Oryza glaberrima TaxID=4538 RepID=I1QMY9_ORYGL|nr:bifunctional protein FolD 1, mitochondrial-like isoform X1 [Oryza glaberrima]